MNATLYVSQDPPAIAIPKMKVDSAVVRALRLDASKTTVVSHGGSGFSSTAKITTVNGDDGSETQYFMKTGSGADAETMFAGEHASLNALHTVPSLCPRSFAHGKLADSNTGGAFLVTEFLDMSSQSKNDRSSKGSGMSLATKLAKLHTTPAPVPEGYSEPMFGFPVATCCGSTRQENDFTRSWADFYGKHRLHFILRQCEQNNGKDAALRKMVEQTVSEVVPRLIGDQHLNHGKGVTPVVIHGDVCFAILTFCFDDSCTDFRGASYGAAIEDRASSVGKERSRK